MALLSVDKAAKALREHRGIILRAAIACNVDRSTFWRFMQKHPELEDVRNECNEELLDVAEDHVTQALENGDMKTVRWHLERRGKDRGYTTRQETTGRDGAPLAFDRVERHIVKPSKD